MCERGSSPSVKGPKSPGPKSPTAFVSTYPPSVDSCHASIISAPLGTTIGMDVPITHGYPTTSMGVVGHICVPPAPGQAYAIKSSPPPPPHHHQQSSFTQLLQHDHYAMAARMNSGPILEGTPEVTSMHHLQQQQRSGSGAGNGSRKKQVLKEEVLPGHPPLLEAKGSGTSEANVRALSARIFELGQWRETLKEHILTFDAKYNELCDELRKVQRGGLK